MIYIPNTGELLALKSILSNLALRVGLYKNVLNPDNSTNFLLIQELNQGGGRGYATKNLPNVVNESALAAGQWFLGVDNSGRGSAQYCDPVGGPAKPYLEWAFNDFDMADNVTIYGAFGYALIIPFKQGATAINPGDTVAGETSLATAAVTAVWLASGSWAGGDAAGWLAVKNQTGVFQNGEDLQVSAATMAVSNTGTLFAGDSLKTLVFMESFTDPKAVTLSGQKLQYTLTLSMGTG
jgi:hypothetical protein